MRAAAGGNDWWPLNRKWLAARGLSEGPVGTAASRCRMVGGGAKRRLRGEGPQVPHGGPRAAVGPRVARRVCTRLEGRPRAAVGAESGAAPRLFGSLGVALTAQGRLQSWGPARGRPQAGVLGVRLARSGGPPPGGGLTAHSPYTTLPVPLARSSVGSALHPQDGVWGPSRGAVPEAGDSGERCRGAAPARSGALGIGKRGAHSEEASAQAFPAISRASALQAGESG